jgi:hypothetical protein
MTDRRQASTGRKPTDLRAASPLRTTQLRRGLSARAFPSWAHSVVRRARSMPRANVCSHNRIAHGRVWWFGQSGHLRCDTGWRPKGSRNNR